MTNVSVTQEGISQAVSSLKYKTNSIKYRVIQAIQQVYTLEGPASPLESIETDQLIKIIWDTGDNPTQIKAKRRNFFSLRSAINSDLSKLSAESENPERITISQNNTFDMSEDAKNEILSSFSDVAKSGNLDLNQVADVLSTITDFISSLGIDADSQNDDTQNKLEQIKKLLQTLSDSTLPETETSSTDRSSQAGLKTEGESGGDGQEHSDSVSNDFDGNGDRKNIIEINADEYEIEELDEEDYDSEEIKDEDSEQERVDDDDLVEVEDEDILDEELDIEDVQDDLSEPEEVDDDDISELEEVDDDDILEVEDEDSLDEDLDIEDVEDFEDDISELEEVDDDDIVEVEDGDSLDEDLDIEDVEDFEDDISELEEVDDDDIVEVEDGDSLDEDLDIEDVEDFEDDISELEEVDDDDIVEVEDEDSLDEDLDIEDVEDFEDDISELEEVDDDDIVEVEDGDSLDEDLDIEDVEDFEDDISELEEVDDDDIVEVEDEDSLDEDLDIEDVENFEDDISELEEVDDDDIVEVEDEDSLDEDLDIEDVENFEDDISELEEVDDDDILEVEDGDSLDEDLDIEDVEDFEDDISELEEVDDDDIVEVEDEDSLDEDLDIEDVEDFEDDISELEEVDDDDIVEVEDEDSLDEDLDIEDVENFEDDISELEEVDDDDIIDEDDLLEFDENELEDFREFQKNKELANHFDDQLADADKKFNIYETIPAGHYTVGSTRNSKNRLPLQEIEIEKFYIGKYPVTNSLFEAFIHETGYTTTAEKKGYGTVFFGRFTKDKDKTLWRRGSGNDIVKNACWYQPEGPGSSLYQKKYHPVVQVSVEDAMTFASWIGRRLPSESEWEAMARTDNGLKYPWGNEWKDNACNTERSGVGGTTPVDKYEKYCNPLSVVDLLGNTLEWTCDTLSNPYSKRDNGRFNVAKGSAWNATDAVSIGSRTLFKSGYTSNTIGFRCISEYLL